MASHDGQGGAHSQRDGRGGDEQTAPLFFKGGAMGDEVLSILHRSTTEFTAGIIGRAMHAPTPESGCIFYQAITVNQESDSKVTCTSSFSITNLETVTFRDSYGIHHIPLGMRNKTWYLVQLVSWLKISRKVFYCWVRRFGRSGSWYLSRVFSSDKVAPEGLGGGGGALALARRNFLASEFSSRLMIELTKLNLRWWMSRVST